jgi:ceramide glucosyltransferase
MHTLLWLLWIPIAVTSAWIVAGLGAVASLTRRPHQLRGRPPAVSVLKPLCGRDPGLRQNLESFFRQDHPDFELVFGVVGEHDPALDVVRELAREYPAVRCQIVAHSGQGALNPKVDNLLGMLPRAEHDLVLVSDSNVRAPAHYVRELATLYATERPGLVTNLFAGVGEDSLGAALENVQLSGFCAAGIALPTLLGDAILVGKSALFSRRRLDRLGGLRKLSDVLAEDYVMGKTFHRAGGRIIVAPTVLENVTHSMTLRAMLARHLRWTMMRFRLLPIAAALEPLTSPLVLLPLAWIVLGPWAIAWAVAMLGLRDLGGWLVLRGSARWYLPIVLAPLREVLVLGVWCVAPLKQHVSWRGKRFRLGAGTLLYLEPSGVNRASAV